MAVLESLILGDDGTLDPRLRAQIRLNLARGLGALGEKRAAAEELLRLADAVAGWPDDRRTHTLVACETAAALARAELWDAARSAYRRALAAHGTAPRPTPVVAMMREFARLTMAAQEADGLPAALAHLAEADVVCAEVPDGAPDFTHWYERGATHYQRARAYADAQRYDDALTEIEHAVTTHESGGAAGEEPRAEAIRVAALIEANGLDSVPAATARLTAAITRCEAAGFPEAAATLASTRVGLTGT